MQVPLQPSQSLPNLPSAVVQCYAQHCARRFMCPPQTYKVKGCPRSLQWSTAYVGLQAVKTTETEKRMVAAMGWEKDRMSRQCLRGIEFQFRKVEESFGDGWQRQQHNNMSVLNRYLNMVKTVNSICINTINSGKKILSDSDSRPWLVLLPHTLLCTHF